MDDNSCPAHSATKVMVYCMLGGTAVARMYDGDLIDQIFVAEEDRHKRERAELRTRRKEGHENQEGGRCTYEVLFVDVVSVFQPSRVNSPPECPAEI